MTNNLWSANIPRNFWQCEATFEDAAWEVATQRAFSVLKLTNPPASLEDLMAFTLGEGQFGPDHWQLKPLLRFYYLLKPFLPRILIDSLRRALQTSYPRRFELDWPIESRFAAFQFEILRNLIELSDRQTIRFQPFWPAGADFAFVLTHDIETASGQQFVRCVADLEESLGFRSSFNFVPEGYPIDMKLLEELRQRGFEIGVHGLKHDEKLFLKESGFMRRAERINQYLHDFGAVGFRAPLTHRHPEWMQALDIEYDLSFFDTDPFEPMPGGTMSIWPFFLGHFVELPYTLVQDHTLTTVLGESTPHLWLKKVDFIEKYHGMALLISHPDYLQEPANMRLYSEFLSAMQARGKYWHATPRDAAAWWKQRCTGGDSATAYARIIDAELEISQG